MESNNIYTLLASRLFVKYKNGPRWHSQRIKGKDLSPTFSPYLFLIN
jgi:hypothetical protein